MRNLTRVTHLLIADIESGAGQYRKLFRSTLNIDYVELAFKEYENNLRMSAKNTIRLTFCRIKLFGFFLALNAEK
jgi:hypothetical protein